MTDQQKHDRQENRLMPEGEPSRLPEVMAALRLMGEEWHPDPAAPACRAVRYEQHGASLAA